MRPLKDFEWFELQNHKTQNKFNFSGYLDIWFVKKTRLRGLLKNRSWIRQRLRIRNKRRRDSKKRFVPLYKVQNIDESSIQSRTKPRVLMEFPWKLAAARQCRLCREQRESALFNNTLSLILPISISLISINLTHVRILYLRRSLFCPFLRFSLPLSLSFSLFCDELVTARSSPVKPYLVTARNMLCEPTYPFAFTYRSGAAPQDAEESPGNGGDDWKYSVAGFSPSTRFRNPRSTCRCDGIAPPGMA